MIARIILSCCLVFGSAILSHAKESSAGDATSVIFGNHAPGVANQVQNGDVITLSNQTFSCSWSFAGGKLQPLSFTETATSVTSDFSKSSAFRVGVAGVDGLPAASGFVPTNLSSGDFLLVGQPKVKRVVANLSAVKSVERFAGWMIEATLKHAVSGTCIRWSAELRDGSHYLRQSLRITGEKGSLTAIQGLDLPVSGAKNMGSATAGNPAATESLFMGMEQPMAQNDFSHGMAAGLKCQLPIEKNVIYELSSVIGCYPKGQLRRAFLLYLERERAAPYRQFLHYNGWFDFDRNVSEKGTIDTIKAYQDELMGKRGVPVKAFVIDDGWDDWDSGFWAINRKKFPNGFKDVGRELDRVNSRFGIWLSPLAGYDHANQRIALAAKDGLTRDGSQSLDLSYPPYYQWFLDKTTHLIKDDKVAYFKFDKAGSGVNPHFLSLLRICHELRKVDPRVVINITVGTWPSPFWLNHIDCTWRDGNDMGYEGPGHEREQWITYRDAQTWRGVVSKGPLYPLNSIMNHGVCLSDGHMFPKKALKGGTDMRHEVRTFFGSGTLMQELYVKPSITPQESWDQIAEAAKWSAAHADVLVDSHWIGGNPSGGKAVYGWAAWSPRMGVITLRNPSDSEMNYALDIKDAFELPAAAVQSYRVKSAYGDTESPMTKAVAGQPITLTLKPFEVIVLELSPS